MFVFDRETMLRRCGDLPDVVEMLGTMLVDDLDNNIQPIARALESKDLDALCREAHSIKGLLGMFVDDDGAAMSHELEQKIRQHGITAETAQEVAALQDRVREVAEVIRQQVLQKE